MAPKHTKFCNSWKTRRDFNGNLVSEWVREDKTNPGRIICCVCNVPLDISSGFTRLWQHSDTKKHRNSMGIHEKQYQLLSIVSNATAEIGSNDPSIVTTVQQPEFQSSSQIVNEVKLYNPRDAASRAELYCCMDTVKMKASFLSCANKKELFEAMFPGCIPPAFSLSATKVAYIVTEALGPYFKSMMLKDLKDSDAHFTLQFDETTNVKDKKELQIRVIFWSNSQSKVVNRHLVTYFIENGTAVILSAHLFRSLDSHNLSINRVLHLGRDGPNVNKAVLIIFQNKLRELEYKELIDIGSCMLHCVNNAFGKGLDCMSIDISDFLFKIFNFFDGRPERTAKFQQLQTELNIKPHKLIKHITVRWLTAGPSAERALEQMKVLKKYFLQYLSRSEPQTVKKVSYQDIVKYLQNPLLEGSLRFAHYAAELFNRKFTALMQRDEPLIHILYSQLKKLVQLLLLSIFKPKVIEELPKLDLIDVDSLLSEKDNVIELKLIECSDKVKESISTLPDSDKLRLLHDIKQFTIKASKYIIDHVKNLNLDLFECVSPFKIKDSSSVDSIVKIAKLLPIVDIDTDTLSIEWRLIQIDKDIHFPLPEEEYERVDTFWNRIFLLHTMSVQKYPVTAKVVKSVLSLVHGSAGVERGFSESGEILSNKKNRMIERTLNALIAILEGLKVYENMVHKVPMTTELLKLAQQAHSAYQAYKEEQNRLAETQKKKAEQNQRMLAEQKETAKKLAKDLQSMDKLETKLKAAENALKEKTKDAEDMLLIMKNTSKIKSVNNNSMSELLSSYEKLRDREKEQLREIKKIQTDLASRRKRVIKKNVKKSK